VAPCSAECCIQTATLCNTLQYNMAPCSAECHSFTATSCNILDEKPPRNVAPCCAECSSDTATHCNTRQHTTTHLHEKLPRDAALCSAKCCRELQSHSSEVQSHCNCKLQSHSSTRVCCSDTATHCKTLQHTATPCSRPPRDVAPCADTCAHTQIPHTIISIHAKAHVQGHVFSLCML